MHIPINTLKSAIAILLGHIFLGETVQAQIAVTNLSDVGFEWATYWGNFSADYGRACKVDSDGNAYFATNNSHILEFDEVGNFLATGFALTDIMDIERDSQGNIYMVGNTSINDPRFAGSFQSTVLGNTDPFIVKLDSSGNWLWGTYFGSTGTAEMGNSLAVDYLGNVFVCGTTSNTFAYADTHQTQYGGGNSDGFLAKFSPNGTYQWSTFYGGLGSDFVYSCATDPQGNIFIAGNTESTTGIAMNGHDNTYNSNEGAFLAKFDPNGLRVWGTYYGWVSTGSSCATDASSNVYMVGRVRSDTGIAANGFQMNHNGGFYDGYMVKFASNGQRLWGTYFGGEGSDHIVSCSVNSIGNILITGNTKSDSLIAYRGYKNSRPGNDDTFIAEFNLQGQRIWSTYFGGPGNDYATDCDISDNRHIIVTGTTGSTSQIAENGYQTILKGSTDAYLAKFGLCDTSFIEIFSQTACDTFFWPISGKTYYGDTRDTAFMTTSKGCDSLFVLDLTIAKIDSSPIWYGGQLHIQKVADQFQWLDCADGFAPIAGANDSIYTPTSNGIYAVQIKTNDCIDTSECILVNNVGTRSTDSIEEIFIYPNPTDGEVTIEIDYDGVAFEIQDPVGRVIQKGSLDMIGTFRATLTGGKGIYIVSIANRKGQQAYYQIIKL